MSAVFQSIHLWFDLSCLNLRMEESEYFTFNTHVLIFTKLTGTPFETAKAFYSSYLRISVQLTVDVKLNL